MSDVEGLERYNTELSHLNLSSKFAVAIGAILATPAAIEVGGEALDYIQSSGDDPISTIGTGVAVLAGLASAAFFKGGANLRTEAKDLEHQGFNQPTDLSLSNSRHLRPRPRRSRH